VSGAVGDELGSEVGVASLLFSSGTGYRHSGLGVHLAGSDFGELGSLELGLVKLLLLLFFGELKLSGLLLLDFLLQELRESLCFVGAGAIV
jgi:hypothetical protein